jgi:hypothetical protein
MENTKPATLEEGSEEVAEIVSWLKEQAEKSHIPIYFSSSPSYESPLTITIPAVTGSIVGDVGEKVEILQNLEDSWNEKSGKRKRRLLLVPSL